MDFIQTDRHPPVFISSTHYPTKSHAPTSLSSPIQSPSKKPPTTISIIPHFHFHNPPQTPFLPQIIFTITCHLPIRTIPKKAINPLPLLKYHPPTSPEKFGYPRAKTTRRRTNGPVMWGIPLPPVTGLGSWISRGVGECSAGLWVAWRKLRFFFVRGFWGYYAYTLGQRAERHGIDAMGVLLAHACVAGIENPGPRTGGWRSGLGCK